MECINARYRWGKVQMRNWRDCCHRHRVHCHHRSRFSGSCFYFSPGLDKGTELKTLRHFLLAVVGHCNRDWGGWAFVNTLLRSPKNRSDWKKQVPQVSRPMKTGSCVIDPTITDTCVSIRSEIHWRVREILAGRLTYDSGGRVDSALQADFSVINLVPRGPFFPVMGHVLSSSQRSHRSVSDDSNGTTGASVNSVSSHLRMAPWELAP